jgi:hypothetical protein
MPKVVEADNRALHGTMEEIRAVIVFDKILHLGVMLTDWADSCGQLIEFVEEIDDGVIAELKPRLDLSRLANDENDEDERLHEFGLCCLEDNRFGFLVHIKAPETIRYGNNGGKSVNSGICRLRWFYGESLQEVIDQGNEWALSLEKVKAAKK